MQLCSVQPCSVAVIRSSFGDECLARVHVKRCLCVCAEKMRFDMQRATNFASVSTEFLSGLALDNIRQERSRETTSVCQPKYRAHQTDDSDVKDGAVEKSKGPALDGLTDTSGLLGQNKRASPDTMDRIVPSALIPAHGGEVHTRPGRRSPGSTG